MTVARAIVLALLALPVIQCAARTPRSHAAKTAFAHQNPCPSTHKPTAHCPGYVIDHVIPLDCGGADAPSNMAWQTIADGKAKDKWERKMCGR